MANEIVNEQNMDRVLNQLGKTFSEKEAWEINGAAMRPFETTFKNNLSAVHDAPLKKDEVAHLKDTLVVNKVRGGDVEIGFSRKGKKSYIGRLLNDGWDVRNQHGGPYVHKEGLHYWEKTETSTESEVKKAELSALKQVMRKRVGK